MTPNQAAGLTAGYGMASTPTFFKLWMPYLYPGNSPLSWSHPGSTAPAFAIVLDKPMPVAEEVT